MAWKPVFSPDSRHVAAKLEKDGRHVILLDGKPFKEDFSAAWDPQFSPDSDKLMIRAVAGNASDSAYIRHIVPLTEF